MLNRVIELSIRNRFLVICAAVMLLVYGALVVARMPVDVLPDLNRPVVTILTEAHGLAPEDAVALVQHVARERSRAHLGPEVAGPFQHRAPVVAQVRRIA